MTNNIDSVDYVNGAKIEGDIVEIGVWKGGSMLAMMMAHERGSTPIKRTFHLYDTFEGMTAATEADKDAQGNSAAKLMEMFPDNIKCISPLEEVRGNIERHTAIVPQYHVGDIMKNTFVPEKIAVLRLDTDWYESTKHELATFYESVVPGGIVIIDDYGHWEGCRKAVDEFLESRPEIVLFSADYTGRWFVKPKADGL
jgi:O-methyltransferase